mmetsp:Transcript_15080/g.33181  ORF Transcript_15080/g.33181 Transcript_15080/m.33181 type:complete len:107 (-) Transcript_15080:27-347(-)
MQTSDCLTPRQATTVTRTSKAGVAAAIGVAGMAATLMTEDKASDPAVEEGAAVEAAVAGVTVTVVAEEVEATVVIAVLLPGIETIMATGATGGKLEYYSIVSSLAE